VAAAKKQSLRFGFVDSPHDAGSWAPLAGILREYLDVYQRLGKDTSLVVLFRPEEQPSSMDEYFRRFWAVLQFLHDGDTEPWRRRLRWIPRSSGGSSASAVPRSSSSATPRPTGTGAAATTGVS